MEVEDYVRKCSSEKLWGKKKAVELGAAVIKFLRTGRALLRFCWNVLVYDRGRANFEKRERVAIMY